jgi:hypothetical protein
MSKTCRPNVGAMTGYGNNLYVYSTKPAVDAGSEGEAVMLANWLCMLVPIAGFVVIYRLLHRRALRRLRAWVAAQGYDLIRLQNPPLRPGPFFLQHGRGWAVMQIVVRNGDGGERVGWVCYPAGLPVFEPPELQRVQLVWDDEWDRKRGPFDGPAQGTGAR